MDFPYGYGYDAFGALFGDPDFLAVFGVIVAVLLFEIVIGLIFRLTLYILRSIGLHRLAANRGMSGVGLEWIPFIGSYRIGSVADDISARAGKKSYYRYILLIVGIINFITPWVVQVTIIFPWIARFFNNPFDYGYHRYGYRVFSGTNTIILMISLAVFVVTVIALNKIYKCYSPINSTSWTVLSVIFPFMQSIFPFIICNFAPVPEWGAGGYYPAQNQGWQAPPPQYPPYGQPPADSGYYPPQYMTPPPPADVSYQPPAAPNPPEQWELDDPASQPPPQAPVGEKRLIFLKKTRDFMSLSKRRVVSCVFPANPK